MADLETVNLIDLVPDSIASDQTIKDLVNSIDGELKKVSALCDVPALYSRIDELDSTTLDHMAWQVDSKVWRDNWPIDLKRRVIRTVIIEKSKKGTLYAIKQALEAFGSAVLIREWWETTPKGTPHTFEIVLSIADIEGLVDSDIQQDLILRLNDVKPARSHYTLQLAVQSEGAMGFIGYGRSAVFSRIDGIEQPVKFAGSMSLSGAGRSMAYARIDGMEQT